MTPEYTKFFTDLYAGQFLKLYKWIYFHSYNEELAYDIAQETFSLLWAKIGDIVRHKNPEGWIFKTGNYLLSNEKKRRRRQEEPYAADPALLSGGEDETELWEIFPSTLTEKDREILLLRYRDNLPFEEIRKLLGISNGTCRTRANRALAKCREAMEENS